MIEILENLGKLSQNDGVMRRLTTIFILTAILITAIPAFAHVVDVNGRNYSSYGISKTIVPRFMYSRIICQNNPVNRIDPTGRKDDRTKDEKEMMDSIMYRANFLRVISDMKLDEKFQDRVEAGFWMIIPKNDKDNTSKIEVYGYTVGTTPYTPT